MSFEAPNIQEMINFWQSKKQEDDAKNIELAKEKEEKLRLENERLERLERVRIFKEQCEMEDLKKEREERRKKKEEEEVMKLFFNATANNKPEHSEQSQPSNNSVSTTPPKDFDQEADQIISSLRNQINTLMDQCENLDAQITQNTPDQTKLIQLQLAKKQLDEIKEMSWRQSFDHNANRR